MQTSQYARHLIQQHEQGLASLRFFGAGGAGGTTSSVLPSKRLIRADRSLSQSFTDGPAQMRSVN